MAADTEPLEILLHLPLLAEDKVLFNSQEKILFLFGVFMLFLLDVLSGFEATCTKIRV